MRVGRKLVEYITRMRNAGKPVPMAWLVDQSFRLRPRPPQGTLDWRVRLHKDLV